MNNYVYLYNGSWTELILLIDYLLKEKRKPLDIQAEDNYQQNLIDQTIYLHLENQKNIYQKWKTKTSFNVMKVAYYVYLSNNSHKELVIYYFLLNGLKFGDKVRFLRNLKCVNQALNISHYVFGEAHRLKGFLRFKEMNNGFLYAEMAPENNIIWLLSNHFKKRLSQENWMIKDEQRNIYCLYDTNQTYFLTKEEIVNLNLNYTKEEEGIEEMWKLFFKTIAIKERKNYRAQRNFMPLKYRKYMLETEE